MGLKNVGYKWGLNVENYKNCEVISYMRVYLQREKCIPGHNSTIKISLSNSHISHRLNMSRHIRCTTNRGIDTTPGTWYHSLSQGRRHWPRQKEVKDAQYKQEN